MAKVIVYVKDYCPYCTKAKNLLKKKNVSFEEIDITHDYELQDYVVELTGRRTVPQILINGKPVGGSDDIHYLNSIGELDKLLLEEEEIIIPEEKETIVTEKEVIPEESVVNPV